MSAPPPGVFLPSVERMVQAIRSGVRWPLQPNNWQRISTSAISAKRRSCASASSSRWSLLIVARLGTYIPMPGIDPGELPRLINQQQGGLLDMFNVLSGGAVQRMAIFALGIMPYISASIIIQLMTTVFPELEALKERRRSRAQDHQSVYALRHGRLAALQAFGIAIGLEHTGNVVHRSRLVLPHSARWSR